MRIVSGHYGGRHLQVPKGRDIRPTSDKIRGAIFNALRSRGSVEEAHVLDCFCGTGALGLEALSQGAKACTFIDKNRTSLDLAKENSAMLGIGDEAEFLLKDSSKLSVRPENIPPFDLVFLDPPYAKGLIVPTLKGLYDGAWLAKGAVCVIEVEKNFAETLPECYELLNKRNYGETKIIYGTISPQ